MCEIEENVRKIELGSLAYDEIVEVLGLKS